MSCPTSSGCDPVKLTADRISSLPSNVLEIILGKLPITDAVRTSLLAKDWKYKWLSVTDFVFESSRLFTKYLIDKHWGLISSMINSYLLNHSASIRRFGLKTFCGDHYSDVYQWIYFLSKQGIQIFLFEEFGEEHFKIPSHLFFFEKLEALHLGNCTFQVPTTFGKFEFLTELLLRYISTTDNTLERLIIGCPALEQLTLLSIQGVKHLKINAPKLKSLLIDNLYEDISIENAEHLAVFITAATLIEPAEGTIIRWRSYIRSLANLPSLAKLAISGGLVKILAADYGLEGCPLRNNHLTALYVNNIRFDTIEAFRVCLAILSTCPNINIFGFSVESAKGSKFVSGFFTENRGQFCFPQLNALEMVYSSGMGSAMDLVEFLASHAPRLRKIIIRKAGEMHIPSSLIRKICSRLRKCCPQAVTEYKLAGRNRLVGYQLNMM